MSDHAIEASMLLFHNDEITAQDNLAFLLSWFEKFPAYKGRDFFITGESYAGHFVPQLAELILNSTKINLKGVTMGNPLLDFETDYNTRGEFFMSQGLIRDETLVVFTKVCNFSEMSRQFRNGLLTPICDNVHEEVFREISGSIDIFYVTLDVCTPPFMSRFLKKKIRDDKVDVCIVAETINYLNRRDVQHALHAKLVGVSSWTFCSSIIKYDYQDTDTSMLPLLRKLIGSGIRVLVYSGDQDSVIPFLGTRRLVHALSKEVGLSTTVPYRPWFQGKEVVLENTEKGHAVDRCRW